MKATLQRKGLLEAFDDVFVYVAFAEEGDLYAEHPRRPGILSELFARIAFAESGEGYEEGDKYEAPTIACVLGETPGGLCV